MKTSLIASQQTSLSSCVHQAIALLPLSTQDLNIFLQKQLDENPFLMTVSSHDNFYISHSSIDYITKTVADVPSKLDDVMRQLYVCVTNDNDCRVGVWILHHLDEHGFFRMPLEDAAVQAQTTPKHIQALLDVLHTFEPVGVASSGIAHCWRLQLKEQGKLTREMDQFLQCVEKLSSQSLAQVSKTLGYSLSLCRDMLCLLRKLPPYPLGLSEDAHTLVPDVLTEQGWSVRLNTEVLPELLLNHTYVQDVRKHIKKPEDKAFVHEKIEHARWLIRALSERAHHVLSVAKSIVEWQQGYWRHGDEAIVPMTLKDIAEKTELHMSTVSRITANKYIQTPYGTVPFKYFFTRSLVSLNTRFYDNQGASSKAIQHQLKKFVQEEPTQAPFSDDHLFSLFQQKGVAVARRTINKYRQHLNIPSSSERKRLYALSSRSLF